jgi:glycosyltransferase involved in cell wall biosynthesis
VTASIDAVAVVVPARDEEDGVEACLTSVRTALDGLPASVDVAVTVVLDRCVDRTQHRVETLLADWPEAAALIVGAVGRRRATAPAESRGATHIVAGSGVGALRDLGLRDALGRLRPQRPEAVWLLNTDADTTVPPGWASAHRVLALAGAAAVAGMVDLGGPHRLSDVAASRHAEIVGGLTDGDRHRNVYGANLGVRADAYLAVGGFPVDGAGEDHRLWSALRDAGYPVRQPTGLRVLTSARTVGRATGGLADLLHALHDAPDGWREDAQASGFAAPAT